MRRRILLTLHADLIVILKEIIYLSNKINKNDNHKTFEITKDHLEEKEEIYNENNKHWAIETTDLNVLCNKSLILENKDINNAIKRSLLRFYKLKEIKNDCR